MKYLGIEPIKPRLAVFDFTSCEGCELQLANGEETLVEFLGSIDVVDFREISSARGDDYDIAMIEGAITRSDEIDRLLKIREKATTLIALGTCACFGGVNKLKLAAWNGKKWQILPQRPTDECPFPGQGFIGAVEVLITRPWSDPPVGWGN